MFQFRVLHCGIICLRAQSAERRSRDERRVRVSLAHRLRNTRAFLSQCITSISTGLWKQQSKRDTLSAGRGQSLPRYRIWSSKCCRRLVVIFDLTYRKHIIHSISCGGILPQVGLTKNDDSSNSQMKSCFRL